MSEILNEIEISKETLERSIKEKLDNDSCFIHLQEYENLLMDICRYWWEYYDPSTFYKCYATGEEYEKCNKSKYSWYIALVNSRNGFIDFMKNNKLTDYDCHTICKNAVVQKRKEIALKLFHKPSFKDFKSFLEWCITNISL